jgi:hypothetical protein
LHPPALETPEFPLNFHDDRSELTDGRQPNGNPV